MHIAELRSYLEADNGRSRFTARPTEWARKGVLNHRDVRKFERSNHSGICSRTCGGDAGSGEIARLPSPKTTRARLTTNKQRAPRASMLWQATGDGRIWRLARPPAPPALLVRCSRWCSRPDSRRTFHLAKRERKSTASETSRMANGRQGLPADQH